VAFSNLLGELDPAVPGYGSDLAAPQATKELVSRVTRSRRHFGSYRHDLLVAMRVIGKVEREMLAAEWENWVWNEAGRCKAIEGRIGQEGEQSTQGLQEWWQRYCGSCLQEAQALEALS
jgi:hypothetical protein